MSAYEGRRILVAGVGVAGAAAAGALLELGAKVTVADRAENEALARLRAAGAATLVGDDPTGELLLEFDEVVVSPGFAPHTPVARAAVAAGLPIYSEPELAWRLRDPAGAPWLAVTGTNGKTTTTTMLAAILAAAGLRVAALGNIGRPLVDAARDPDLDVLAVELSSFQLFWSTTMAPPAGALLNLAPDHLEWHGTYAHYVAAKRVIWRAADAGTGVAVGNLDDPAVASLLAQVARPVVVGPGASARRELASPAAASRVTAVGVTLGEPGPGQLGVLDGHLVDRAFGSGGSAAVGAGGSAAVGSGGGEDLGPTDAVHPAGPHNVANALHAAALARAHGVAPSAVRAGLAGYTPEPHRNALIATVGGVAYVDDSKATNPHAARASLTAYPRVVWVAGGQLKGVDIDELVAQVADRLAGAVLLGADRDQVARALSRHAPNVPVVDVSRTDDGAMAEVVAHAAALARPGDTVLLAPAAASLDMYRSYAHRGDAFAAQVRQLT